MIKQMVRLAWLPLVGMLACSQYKDTPIRGEITIASDESFQPMVDAIYKAYEGVYTETKFNVLYRPEQAAINTLLQDSARLVFAARDLNEREKAALQQQKITTRSQVIATDGIALIVGRGQTDSLMTMTELKAIFEGRLKDWSQLEGNRQSGPIVLVFDNNNSSNLNYMLAKLGVNDVSNLRIFTTRSNREVIDYVRKNPTALGFIGVNWISDGDTPLTDELSRDIRVLGVSDKTKPASVNDYYQPFQANLAMQRYPLRRKVWVISREVHSGLGGGLMTYIARDVGGLLIEKSGLWPQVPYNRTVELRKN